MSVEQFAQHLYGTPVSSILREVAWIVPALQSVHILAVAAVVGAALAMDLRLAGVLATDETPRTLVRRHLPWMWSGFGLLLVSGMVLGLAEPYRVLMNPIFWAKMVLVLTGFFFTILFRYPILHPDYKIEHSRAAALVKPMAWVSLVIWVAVVFCGRWIAYYQ